MQTQFSPEALADPAMATSEGVIRKCVHCGFCTATCPTYVLLGDENDSPRGRIYLIKDMLENQREPGPETVKHVDRCLSCLACMTTCPSGVNYMHLVDHARAYIHENYRRPWPERAMRRLLAWVLPYPGRMRLALELAPLGRPLVPLMKRLKALRPLAAMVALAPARVPAPVLVQPARRADAKGRVALLQGCAEPVLSPQVRAATVRLLERAGREVVFAQGEGCCGALVHHMGRESDALDAARRNVDAWMREIEGMGLDAVIITTSGCGTTIKDYGHMLRADPAYAEKAARVSALAMDVSEYLAKVGLPVATPHGMTVAYHPPCSLQHGQKVTEAPKRLLALAGYTVRLPAEAHLCCGSAGTYNILQSELAGQLGARKAERLAALEADVIATGNIGCAVQIARHSGLPVVHTIELLDWATGGPRPQALNHLPQE
ncbi:glycolate oxidase subunit GlcF [Novosphingobium sp. AAP93]|uniref:glycolate oxidase subunit GlcF n=1 Tax=Novosphingobium sp. AAP93 TaxID=1523427 RepID=UPI0006B94B42|nr:glycolate oxidase subunit GlcF [Novosphingobium sp. AAP93]KPF89524.1 2-hydroxy-acid oxidase [Novosphingobium sp. AAP93]